jgi:hypothetical protein
MSTSWKRLRLYQADDSLSRHATQYVTGPASRPSQSPLAPLPLSIPPTPPTATPRQAGPCPRRAPAGPKGAWLWPGGGGGKRGGAAAASAGAAGLGRANNGGAENAGKPGGDCANGCPCCAMDWPCVLGCTVGHTCLAGLNLARPGTCSPGRPRRSSPSQPVPPLLRLWSRWLLSASLSTLSRT